MARKPRLEPRILSEAPEKSYHACHRISDKHVFDNRLIFGDNLLALKALEHKFTHRIRYIFIDPQYNTGSPSSITTTGLSTRCGSWDETKGQA